MILERLTGRPRTLLPPVFIGLVCIIAGGLLAAVVAPAPSEHPVWAVAYLVLVPGVVQIALAAGQTALAAHEPGYPALLTQLASFNIGNALVIAGTVADRAWLTDIGSALLVIGLAMFVVLARGAAHRVWRWSFQTIVVLVLISVPIGLVIQYVKGR